MSPTILFIWVASDSKDVNIILPGGDNSYHSLVQALDLFCEEDTDKNKDVITG